MDSAANKRSFDWGEALTIEPRPAEIVANIILCIIHHANYLLDRQLQQLEMAFLREGGLRERMTRARMAERARLNTHSASP